jgi:hypothetical protein
MNRTISKSKYLSGLQCRKLLWTQYNAPDLIPEPDAAKQAIFDTGHEVGNLAKCLYPDGEEVPWSRDLAETAASTRDLLRRRKPIFEASFEFDGRYCRADIMVPVDGDAWDLYEVKSATKVKDINLADVAFQADTVECTGVKLDRLYLMHLDTSYVRCGAIDPHGLFVAQDVTAQARALQPDVAAAVASMHAVIAGGCPEVPIGVHCSAPYDCDLWNRCSAFLPEFAVTQLYRARKLKVFDLVARGITALAEVDPGDLNPNQLVQQKAVSARQPHVQREPIRAWLNGLEYPLHVLDFETMNPAVPLVDGTRPYQHVPFQLSLHIVDHAGAEPRHVEYLAETTDDPRPALIEALRNIGPDGTILAYHMSFEQGVIKKLAEDFPDHTAFLRGLDSRFMDLITPFTSFWFHDAKQRGSCSLKAVLPTLTDKTYEGMAIAEGSQAMREFQRVVFTDVEGSEKNRILQALRDYCRQDTQALIDILGVLRTLV